MVLCWHTASALSIWQQATPINTGTTVTGNFTGVSNKITTYYAPNYGQTFSFASADRIYTFTVAKACWLELPHSGLGNNVALLLNDSSANTLLSVVSSYPVNRVAVGPGRHYLVMEGSSSFTFSVNVKALASGEPVFFSSGTPINCGATLTGDFSAQASSYESTIFYTAPNPLRYPASESYGVPLFRRRSYTLTLATAQYVLIRNTVIDQGISYVVCSDSSNASMVSYGTVGQPYLGPGKYWIHLLEYFQVDPATQFLFRVSCSNTVDGFYQVVKPYAQPVPANNRVTGNLLEETDKAWNYYNTEHPEVTTVPPSYSPVPEAVYKVQSARANNRLTIRRKAPSTHSIYALDSTGSTKNVKGFVYGPWAGNLDVSVASGTYYFTVEQGSASLSDGYDLEVTTTCAPSLSGSVPAWLTNDFTLNGSYLNDTYPQYYYGQYGINPGVGYQAITKMALPLNIGSNNTLNFSHNIAAYDRIFIDFNGDGDFDDASENVYNSALARKKFIDNLVLSSTNAVYAGSLGKELRMRIIVQNTLSTVGACGNLGNAAVIDCYVKIGATMPANTTTPDFRWVRTGNDLSADLYTRVRTAPDGNLYVGGSHTSTYNYNDYNFPYTWNFQQTGLPGETQVYANSGTSRNTPVVRQGVVSRYGRDGSLKWSAHLKSFSTAGNSGTVDVNGLAVDKFGYVYAAGTFNYTMQLLPANGAGTTLVSAGGTDGFVAKFHPDGRLIFAFRFGSTGNDNATGIDVAPDLRFYVAGSFVGSTAITGISGTTVALTSRGNSDAFLAKFSDLGTLYWTIQGGGTGNDFAYGAAADKTGGGYLMGSYEGTATFNSTQAGNVPISKTAVGGSDGFVLGVSVTGQMNWVASMGGPTNENVRDVAPDPRGTGVVAVGGFSQTATFGTTVLSSTGFYDAFAVRLNNAGGFEWATKAGGFGQDQAYGVRLDRNGNPWVALTMQQTVSSFFGGAAVTSTGGSDGVLVRLDASTGQNPSPATLGQVKGVGDEQALGVDTVDGGGALVAGSYSAGVSFGRLGGYANLGLSDAYLARFSAPATGIGRQAQPEGFGTKALLAFPNPTTGSFTIALPEAEAGTHTITIVDSKGQVAAQESASAEELAHGYRVQARLSTGLYIVRCGNATVRVAVQ